MFVPSMTKKEFALEFKKMSKELLAYEKEQIYKPNLDKIMKCARRSKTCQIKRRRIQMNGAIMYLEGVYYFFHEKRGFTLTPTLTVFMKNVTLKDGKFPLICYNYTPFPFDNDNQDNNWKIGEDKEHVADTELVFITKHYLDRARERCPQFTHLDDIDLYGKLHTTNMSVSKIDGENSSLALISKYGVGITNYERIFYKEDNYCLSVLTFVTFIAIDMLHEKQVKDMNREKSLRGGLLYYKDKHTNSFIENHLKTDYKYDFVQKPR